MMGLKGEWLLLFLFTWTHTYLQRQGGQRVRDGQMVEWMGGQTDGLLYTHV